MFQVFSALFSLVLFARISSMSNIVEGRNKDHNEVNDILQKIEGNSKKFLVKLERHLNAKVNKIEKLLRDESDKHRTNEDQIQGPEIVRDWSELQKSLEILGKLNSPNLLSRQKTIKRFLGSVRNTVDKLRTPTLIGSLAKQDEIEKLDLLYPINQQKSGTFPREI